MRNVIIFILLAVSLSFSQPFGEIDDQMGRQSSPIQSRQAQTRENRFAAERQEAQQVFNVAASDLDFLLKQVAAGAEEITEEKLTEISRNFLAVRRGFRYLSKEQQSDMMLIEAWMMYFDTKELEEPLKRAERACALNPTSGDAYASMAVFSILSGEEIKPKEVFLRRVQRRPDEEPAKMTDSVISVDIPDTAMAFIGKNMPAMGGETASDAKTEDNEKEENYSCILIWTLQPEKPDEQTKQMIDAVRSRLSPEQAKIADSLTESPEITKEDVEKQVMAFSSLYENNSAKDKFTFISLNFDSGEILKEFVDKQSPKPIPLSASMLVPANSNIYKAAKLIGSMMAVTDADGTVRYAGGVDNYLTIMLINHLVPDSQKPIDTKAGNKTSYTATYSQEPDMGFNDMMPEDNRQTQPKANVADSNSLPEQTTEDQTDITDAQREENTSKLLPEQHQNAERLLSAARMFRGSHTRLGSSKRVAENCYEVIEKFPGTTYEKEAKEILDSIPDHQKKRLGVD